MALRHIISHPQKKNIFTSDTNKSVLKSTKSFNLYGVLFTEAAAGFGSLLFLLIKTFYGNNRDKQCFRDVCIIICLTK